MTPALLIAPLAVEAVVIATDELAFHRRRGLPRWERIGHPLDTATVVACFAVALALPPTTGALQLYAVLAVFSCLFVTKDERVHAARCSAAEHWLHALLFVLHPIVLAAVALLWMQGATMIIGAQLALTVGFGMYQLLYWNLPRGRRTAA